MARQTNIKLRRSATAGAIPTTSNLDLGELALNTYDGKIYAKTTEGSLDSVIQIGSATDTYHKIRKGNTITITVTVATKTASHPHHGSGSSSAYFLNGIESPHFHMVPGNTYKFDQADSSNSGHPLRFYYEADKTTAYTTGVTTSGTPGSSGAHTTIAPTDATPMVLHYQCSAHGYMGGRSDFATRNFTGFDTDDLTEGSTNLYFTNARARSAISVSGDLSYNSSTGVISFSETTAATTRALISVTDAGGDGSLAYNNSTGVITYTGPSASEVRAHISAGTGVTVSNGQISIGQAVGTSDNVTFNNATVSGTLTSDDITSTNISAAGNLTVTGNLTVSGTSTTINTATLDVEDKNITLNFGSGDTSSTADGAGITIQDAVNSSTNATILWNASNDEFDFSHGITLPDSQKITLGTGSDLEIYHDGVNSYITDVGTGNLKIGGANVEITTAGGTKYFEGASNRAFLFHTGNQKLVTTANGITVSGGVTASGTNVLSGLTYPTSDGSAGQVLQTNGSGTLSFATVSSGTSGVTVQEEGSSLSTAGTTLNFVGSGVTASGTGSTKTITVSGGALTIQEEGSSLSTAGSTLNFVGAGVTASGTGATKTITIPGTGTVSEAFKTIAVSGQSNVVADGATDTLTLAAGSGMTITTTAGTDTITFASSGGGGSASASDIRTKFVYTTSSSTTAFSGSDDNSATLSYTLGAADVYLNGVLQKLTTDYTETNTSTITFVNAVASGNVVEIVAYYKTIGTGNSVVNQFTGNASTTDFTVTTAPVSENNLLVYIDGVYQQKTDYTVSGTTLAFDTAPASGAIIETVAMVGAITTQGALALTGDLSISESTPTITIQDSDATSTFNKTEIQNSGGILNLNTRQSDGTFVSTDYQITKDANGATGHKFFIGGSEKARIHSNGNVGIGTTSPASSLHVYHATTDTVANFESGDSSVAVNFTASDNSMQIATSSTDGIIKNNGAGNFRLFNNGSEKARIDSSGKLGIGTTSPGVSLDVGSLTDAIRVPNGSTGQRPTAALGQLRYNTTTSEFEGYAAGAWGKIGGGGDSFGTIAVSGQTNVVAEQENDTLTFEAGAGIVLTTDASNDKITIAGGSGSVFTTDFFTASGSGSALLAYTLSTTPSSENELICFIEGVYQNKNSYALSGTTLTFDSGIVSGQEVVVHHIGAGIVGTSPTIDTFTGNGSATAYTLSLTPPNENYVQVYWDGVYQHHSEYSVSGTTLTFTSAAPSGTAIEVHTPSVNGIGTPSDATVTPAKLSTGAPSWDGNSNFIVGNSYVRSDSTSISSTSASTVASHAAATYRSVKYQVQITQGSAYHSTELNAIHDGTTVYLTEYGTIFSGSSLATFDATISSGNMLLQVTMGSSSSSTIKVISSAISV